MYRLENERILDLQYWNCILHRLHVTCNFMYIATTFFILGVNECINCHQYANCSNKFGNFSCVCKTGFNGNGTFCQGEDGCFR